MTFQHNIAKFHPNPADYSLLIELSPSDKNITNKSKLSKTPLKILGVDFDHTLVRPKNNRKLPTSWDDYEIIPNALENVKVLVNNFHYIPVIFTNQLGASTGKSAYDINGFADRCIKFMAEFKSVVGVEPFIYIAHYDDKYRKPLPFMWNFAIDDMNIYFDQNKIYLSSVFYDVDKTNNIFDKSFYCGDMYGGYEIGSSGRQILTKSSDLLFAKNNNINFAVAELLFEPYNSSNSSEYYDNKYFVRADKNWINKNITVKIDIAKEYKCGNDYKTELTNNTILNNNTITNISKTLKDMNLSSGNELLKNELFIIILSGSPGSGKSSFAGQILSEVFSNNGYDEPVLLSRDNFKTDSPYYKECVNMLSSGKNIIIDKTNSSIKQRNDIRDKVIQPIIKLMSNKNIEKLHILYIQVSTSKELVMRLNNIRFGNNVPDVAIHTYYKKMEPFNRSDIIPTDTSLSSNMDISSKINISNYELKFSFDTMKEFNLLNFNPEIYAMFDMCW